MARFVSPITDMKPNGYLLFFKSRTNTALVTYKDELETIPNTTEVTVLTNGNVENVFYSGNAKVKYFDEFGQQYAERDPVGGEKQLGDFSDWDSVVSYDINDITGGSDGEFYKSLANGNIGNDPTLTPTQWEQIRFIGTWNTNINYVAGDVVRTSTGNLWNSQKTQSSNDPEVDNGTNWLPAINGEKIPEVIALQELNSWSIPETADFTGVASESRQIDASANTVDVTLPVLIAGDVFTYHNLITSTFKVQILNPIETIKGPSGDIAAGTNMELAPGDSVQMVAKSATVLSIVGAQV